MHDFQTRGLIKPAHGPALKNFPFYDDASVVYSAIRTFFSSFVDSYYTSDKALKADTELQAWIKEAGPAQIKDFPAAPLTIKDALVDMLTHIAQLVAINHNTLNTDTPVHSQATLPLHPVAFYKPLPTGPGTVADVVPYMTPLQAAIGQIVLLASFNRQMYDNTNETIAHMFDQPDMLARMNSKTKVAEATYRGSMQAFSKKVRARTFDKNGLSQGMPFIWKTLDPEGAPFWLAI
jgi:arachidonate 15-lipoxygenase (second type)/8-lipoxygenase (S-type)